MGSSFAGIIGIGMNIADQLAIRLNIMQILRLGIHRHFPSAKFAIDGSEPINDTDNDSSSSFYVSVLGLKFEIVIKEVL